LDKNKTKAVKRKHKYAYYDIVSTARDNTSGHRGLRSLTDGDSSLVTNCTCVHDCWVVYELSGYAYILQTQYCSVMRLVGSRIRMFGI